MLQYKYLTPTFLVFATILLTGCEQDYNLDRYRDPEIEKMLVVNSILNPDSALAVSVTHPYFFSDTHLEFTPADGLDVQISRNDGEWLKMSFNPQNGLYETDTAPVVDGVYNVRILHQDAIVSAADTIPTKPVISHVDAFAEGPMHIYWARDYRFTYKITFQDQPGKENYYFLAIEDAGIKGEFSQMGTLDYTMDYVFQTLADEINNTTLDWKPDGVFGYPFSDKGIDGQLYTITVSEVLQSPVVHMIERLPRKIKLYSVSKAYYKYMVSVLAMDYEESAIKGNLLSLGLMEPEKIYTNIVGGAGIMGSYNLTVEKVDILEMAGGWPQK